MRINSRKGFLCNKEKFRYHHSRIFYYGFYKIFTFFHFLRIFFFFGSSKKFFFSDFSKIQADRIIYTGIFITVYKMLFFRQILSFVFIIQIFIISFIFIVKGSIFHNLNVFLTEQHKNIFHLRRIYKILPEDVTDFIPGNNLFFFCNFNKFCDLRI